MSDCTTSSLIIENDLCLAFKLLARSSHQLLAAAFASLDLTKIVRPMRDLNTTAARRWNNVQPPEELGDIKDDKVVANNKPEGLDLGVNLEAQVAALVWPSHPSVVRRRTCRSSRGWCGHFSRV